MVVDVEKGIEKGILEVNTREEQQEEQEQK